NLERCLFPAASAAKIAGTGAQVVLLSEMDNGMARTAQAHTTAEVAAALSMAFAYGVEFIELGLGSETELEFCTDTHNRAGFHGNAVLAAMPLVRPFLLRLPGQRFWFLSGGDQPRLGERMAIGALVATEAGPVVMVSTHLESNADAAQREAQLRFLIDALETAFPNLPLLIGGDLNTGNHIGGDWRDETLFDHATGRGFTIHGGPETTMTTRPSLITRWPDRAMKLDWFLTRGLQAAQCHIVASTDAVGRPLSDHDMIVLEIAGFAPRA
ncbi:MAG: endonuclease, partial [Cypionkella sp.]